MRVEWGQFPEHFEEFCKLLPNTLTPAEVTWLTSVDAAGKFCGAVVYSSATPWNVEMSMAGHPGWLTRATIHDFFAYPFYQLKVRRVSAMVREDNPRALSIDLRLGFRIEGLRRNWFGDTHGLALGMTKEECKWLSVTAASPPKIQSGLPLRQ